MKTIDAEVCVLGGGPAGATTAALLARQGHEVVVLEKEKFPRYHVGESLMPFCWFTFNRLGLVDQLNARGFQKKYSVQFASTGGHVSAPFYFFQHWDHPAAVTWQVERSEVDEMLLNQARLDGAQVYEQTRATKLLEADGVTLGVEAVGPGGETFRVRAQLTIDATGRDAMAQTKLGWRERDPKLNKVAIWTYYRHAKRDPGLDEGSTTIAYLPHKGWFWYIPMTGDKVSVGVVADRDYLFDESRDPGTIIDREATRNAWIQDHLEGAEQYGEYWVTGEYSYRSRHCASDGLLLVGDAFAFLDPVFSSGVFLALKSGEMAADAAHDALQAGDISASKFAAYGETLCGGIEAMRKLVYAFYDESFSFKDVIMKYPDLRGSLTDRLIGDLFTDSEPLFNAVAEFAELPAPLEHGRAKMNEVTCVSSS